MVDATRLGAWLRSGEGFGWLAAGTMPNSLYRVPFVYLFLACVFCLKKNHSCSFLFIVLFVFFLVLSLELGRCPSDLFLSSRPRTGLATTYIVLGMVEARSVNVKKTVKLAAGETWISCTGMQCTNKVSPFLYSRRLS